MKLDPRVGIILSAALIGCTDPTKHPALCHGDVAVVVGLLEEGPNAGLPVFGWSPACGISFVSVETVPAAGGAGVVVWQLSAPESAPIGPSIIYSRTPRGATELHAAQPLQTAVTYRVTAMSTVGGDGLVGSGTITFHL